MYYNLTRIDILLWRDIHEAGESKEIIESSCYLMDFNLVFDSCTLFHYFADRPNIIELIRDVM